MKEIPDTIVALVFQFFSMQNMLNFFLVCKQWMLILSRNSACWAIESPEAEMLGSRFKDSRFAFVSSKQWKSLPSYIRRNACGFICQFVNCESNYFEGISELFPRLKHLELLLTTLQLPMFKNTFADPIFDLKNLQHLSIYLCSRLDISNLYLFENLRFLKLSDIDLEQMHNVQSLVTQPVELLNQARFRSLTSLILSSSNHVGVFKNQTGMSFLPSIQYLKLDSIRFDSKVNFCNIIGFESSGAIDIFKLANLSNLRYLKLTNFTLLQNELDLIVTTFPLEYLMLDMSNEYDVLNWIQLLRLQQTLKVFSFSNSVPTSLIEVLMQLNQLTQIVLSKCASMNQIVNLIFALHKAPNLRTLFVQHICTQPQITDQIRFQAKISHYDDESCHLLQNWTQKAVQNITSATFPIQKMVHKRWFRQMKLMELYE